jgi:hypothetical protein
MNSLTIEEKKERLVERADPDDLISILDLDGDDMERLVDALHDLIILKEKQVDEFLGETDI